MDADGRGCDWSYRAKIGLTSLGSQRSHPHTIPANIFDSQRSRLLNMPSLEIDMSHRKSSRRSFLAASAALSASAIAAPAVMSATSRKKELHVAAVGVNGMGWSDLSSIGSHASVRFVGFCDIDDRRFDKADAEFRGVPHFADYRVMLGELGDKVDAVIVATPDHMHAPIAMAAMKMGKHIYCQKPLTHTVWEARQMQLLAAKMDLTTQMGNQIHSAMEYRLGVRLIQDGAIGKVKEVHSWVGVQGRQYNNGLAERPAAGTAPSSVQWDLWIGAAPERPFAAEVYHPFNWRNWQDFRFRSDGRFRLPYPRSRVHRPWTESTNVNHRRECRDESGSLAGTRNDHISVSRERTYRWQHTQNCLARRWFEAAKGTRAIA